MEIRRQGPGDVGEVLAAGSLFDDPPRHEWAARFLGSEGHHLLFAYIDGAAAGFVSGVETTHPDKGTEMLLYELGVDEEHRGMGVGRALVEALARLADERGCYGMWVSTEPDNAAAIATYRSGGAGEVEDSITLVWTFDKR